MIDLTGLNGILKNSFWEKCKEIELLLTISNKNINYYWWWDSKRYILSGTQSDVWKKM